MINTKDILETINMIDNENLDVRTITMGISLLSCADSDADRAAAKVYEKITRTAEKLVETGEFIEKTYGIPIINKRISVTPAAMLAASSGEPVKYARVMDRAARELGVNFIGGYSALVQKGFSAGDRELIESIPEALSETERVCSSVNVGSTKAGINMDAVALMGRAVTEAARLTADRNCIGAAKLVTFCNAPEDNPFMAGAFHGPGEPDCVINVGVSGPGVVRAAVSKCPDGDLGAIADIIKRTAFKITRMGQLVGAAASERLGVPFGIVDLSLAPTPAVGDSVAHILEAMGLDVCGIHGTTAALALLNDAVKKGGVMASSHVGGLSGAFIPVSEDAGMIDAARLTSVTIPNSVTSIGKSAFEECRGLTSVTIGNSVTSIGDRAFYNCSGLTSVIIPNSVISIGRSAFENCLLLTSVTIPNSITTIEERTFNWCQHLTSVTIPSSVTSIGEGAFGNCYGLTSVYISDIAAWCNIEFYNSSSNPLGAAQNLYLNGQEVKDLVIPNSVTSIGNYAFYGCSGLTSVTIPNSVTSIADYAFEHCSGLTSVTIPSSVTSIGNYDFYGCSGLTSVTIPNSVTSIGEFAFSDCSGLTSVIIPNSVTSIDACAFSDCSGLTSVTIPNGVTSIEYATFKNCSSLTFVTIGNSVSSIGQDAFYGCSVMTSLTIPDGITSIDDRAFKYCTNLTSVNVKVSDYSTFINNKIGNLVRRIFGKPVVLMDESGNEIKIIIIPNGITAIGGDAFYNCSGLTSVTIPNSVTSIGGSAFERCSGLTSVTIPNSVTSIDGSAFAGCSGLTSVTIPNSVTSIGNKAFYNCSSLTSVAIPNSVTSIGDYAFMDCSGLTSVTIGSGVTSFGSKAFYSENIVTVNSLFEEPSAIEGKSSSSSVFHGDTYNYGKLKVPFGTKDKYKATKGWRDFDTIEEGVDVEIPGAGKCATPTISYSKGELTFSCDTEGAICKYTIADADIQSGSGNKVQLSVAYQVSVVATKEGYNNSETAEATLCWVDVQPQTEGVEVATALQSIEAQPVLIQANGQVVRITGAPEGSTIAIYDTSGQLMGSGKATAGTTDISTQLCNGDVAIVKIGDRAVKVVVK